jgi:hypothetical protein
MPSVEEIRQSCEFGESQPGYQIYIREDIQELLKEIDRQAGLIEQQDRQIIKLHALLVTINNITADVVL